jgi:hypothetical protein
MQRDFGSSAYLPPEYAESIEEEGTCNSVGQALELALQQECLEDAASLQGLNLAGRGRDYVEITLFYNTYSNDRARMLEEPLHPRYY